MWVSTTQAAVAQDTSTAEATSDSQEQLAQNTEQAQPELSGPEHLAQQSVLVPRADHFVLDPLADTLMILGTAAIGMSLQLALPTFGIHERLPPSYTGDILRIDRWRAESQRTLRFPLGDVAVAGAIGLALADTILAGALGRSDSWLEHAGIYVEVAAVMLSITSVAKIAFRRPRPTAYWGSDNLAPDDYLSFFSGHTALAASLSAAAIYMAFTREASGAERAIITVLGITLTALTGVGRVLTGHHYPTDVLMGAAAGTAVGLLVPHLHRRSEGRVQISGTSMTVNF